MGDTLGDRIVARRQKVWDVAGVGPREAAKAHANSAVNALWVHVKNYIDGRIDKLARDNNLKNNP
jgi:hypothetical protein